ncbi:SANT/Myb_domain [Hexamita inflata]|uniref:SANT/Myb domain n=1 Tax=Hexamita inflata TaxID=28002 RepID=A0AA86Q003_9EUKA|nr:SANT/Myb domain [Hexamita inflata]
MNSQLYQIDLLLQICVIQAQITKIKQEMALRQTRTDLQTQTNSKRSRWSQQDDQQLVTQVKLLGIHNYQQIAQKIPNKTASQVYFRLRYLKRCIFTGKGSLPKLFSLTILFQYIIELFTITIYDFIKINKFHKTTSIKQMNQVPNQIIMSTQMIAGLNEQYQQIQMFMDTNLDHPQVLFHDQLRQKYIRQTQMIDSKAIH